MKNNKDHPLIKFGKTGVLIVNLGTPDSTNWFDIRKYLREFLSDKRVIELNPLIWQIILNLFILNFRPSKTAKAYKEIWMKEENISPLLYHTKKQAEKISKSVKKIKVIHLDKVAGSTRSVDIINYLINKKKIKNIHFIIGSDNLIKFHKWKSWKKIVKLTKLIVFSRKGYDRKSYNSIVAKYLKNKIIFIKNKPINISSSKLRKRLKIRY